MLELILKPANDPNAQKRVPFGGADFRPGNAAIAASARPSTSHIRFSQSAYCFFEAASARSTARVPSSKSVSE
jgi:hypothetical protein